MTNQIVAYQPQSIDDVQRTASLLASSGYFDAKGDRQTQIAQVATKIMAGAELGYGPFTAVQGIHVIQGKPAISANLMGAAVKAHPKYDYRVQEMSDDKCSIEFFQLVGGKWEGIGVSPFSMDDAKAAGLLGNPTWTKYPRNMCFSRAMSNGVRWYCPDVFNGNAVYVPEELGADVDADGDIIDVAPMRQQPAQSTPTASPQHANGAHNGVTVDDAPLVEVPPDDHPFEDDAHWRQWSNVKQACEWGQAQGVFNAYTHAKNAYEKLKNTYTEQCAEAGETVTRDGVFKAWQDDVLMRVEVQAEEMAEAVTA